VWDTGTSGTPGTVGTPGTSGTVGTLPAHVPAGYRLAFEAALTAITGDIPIDRARLFRRDATRFLTEWGCQAEALGWAPGDLFGLHPAAPLARYDCMGLIWLLRGERVMAITETAARLSNGLTFYRKGQ